MQVVNDQRHRRVLGRQRRRQPRQEDVVGRPPSRGGRQCSRDGNAGPAQGRDEIGPEDPRPVVVVIQGYPGHRPRFRRRPQRQGHRLARAGWAGDHRQRAPPPTLGDQHGDPRARHRPARHTRRRDLRCQDRSAGGNSRPSGRVRELLGRIGRHRGLPAPSPASDHQAAGPWRSHAGLPAGPPCPAATEGVSPSPLPNASQACASCHRYELQAPGRRPGPGIAEPSAVRSATTSCGSR